MKSTKNISILKIVIFVSAYTFYFWRKNEKDRLIENQRVEIDQLKKKLKSQYEIINGAFNEVQLLAKQNDPSFLAKFKETYPEFSMKFLSKYPDIINSEFTFCAMLKLEFSTKEIAQYTFVTEKAVQARKSRLRKKLKIPSQDDLYIWFSKI